jgi:hypothetical protein
MSRVSGGGGSSPGEDCLTSLPDLPELAIELGLESLLNRLLDLVEVNRKRSMDLLLGLRGEGLHYLDPQDTAFSINVGRDASAYFVCGVDLPRAKLRVHDEEAIGARKLKFDLNGMSHGYFTQSITVITTITFGNSRMPTMIGFDVTLE